jgi:hypothetical protein
VARTRVIRTRVTPDEYDELEQAAKNAGISASELMRRLVVEHRNFEPRIASLERRVAHLEHQAARAWLQSEED